MNATANSGLFAAQNRTSMYTDRSSASERARVADQNRENASIADRVSLQKDTVNIRATGGAAVSPLDTANLKSILEKLTLDIFGDSNKALSAQGNLDPKSVLALLND